MAKKGGGRRRDTGMGASKSTEKVAADMLIQSEEFTSKDGTKFLLRALQPDDLNKGYFEILSQLTVAEKMSEEMFKETFKELSRSRCYRHAVVEDLESHQIAGAAAIFIEQKFVHSGGKVAHIEDVVTDKKYRGQGLGRKLLEELQRCAGANGCYKVILSCADHNIPVYEKINFKKKETTMRYDVPEPAAAPGAPRGSAYPSPQMSPAQ